MNQLYKCLSVDSSELAYVAHLVPTIDNGIISIDVVTHDAMRCSSRLATRTASASSKITWPMP